VADDGRHAILDVDATHKKATILRFRDPAATCTKVRRQAKEKRKKKKKKVFQCCEMDEME
jgi:hypothetical protein